MSQEADGGGERVGRRELKVLVPEEWLATPGTNKIKFLGFVKGRLITRTCQSPTTFLFFTFGSWKCDEVSNTEFGQYKLLMEVSCDEKVEDDAIDMTVSTGRVMGPHE
jgi:hypothetical protein